ncbi:probable 28S ribosomal protein S16, mitochondrial [Dermacentor silvarum]|uniref:probable 28S ribosomal protein S16, mitochondrial n=1 Tax=Dermacentor silvarum TaxID=543639 RepID=UPI00189801E3|nr:probable 28S ribosomal protein S16, mitochondrial [Dermacentor silvarum]
MAGVTQRVRSVRIQLLLKGCANRPFYHLVAARLRRRPRDTDTIEQIGSFDPMPNERNEKLVAINFDRLNYWFGQGAKTSPGAGMLLGLAGYTSVHPKVYMKAWRNRRAALAEEQAGKEAAEAKDEAAKAES